MPKAKKLVKWLAWSGIVLAVSGVCSFVGNKAWYRTRTWFPVDLPIALSVGHVSSPEFTVNVKETFAIQLDVDSEIPKPVMETVLGIGDFPSKPDELRGFRLAWTLLSNGKVVKHEISDGRNQGYWGGRRMGRLLGYFLAEKGMRYRLDLDVLEDASQLSHYDPRVKVGIDIFTLDGYAIGQGLLEFVSLAVAGLGTALFVVTALLNRRSARRHSVVPVS